MLQKSQGSYKRKKSSLQKAEMTEVRWLGMNSELLRLLEKFDNGNSPNMTILNAAKRKQRFKGYKLVADNEIVKKICKAYYDSAKKSLNTMEIEEYDFEGNINGKILELDEELVDVANIEDVIAGREDLISVVNNNTRFDKFNYVAIRFSYEIRDSTELLTIYAKYKQPAKSFKKSFKIAFMNDEIKELKSEVITFEGYAEILQFNGKFYIIQEKTISSLFDYKEGLKNYIDGHQEEIKEYDIMANLDSFISDCKNDGRYSGRLCKAIQTNGFRYVYDAKENLSTYFENFGITLTLNADNEIEYSNKEDINEILKVLLRYYAFDGLNGDKLLVKGVDEVLS